MQTQRKLSSAVSTIAQSTASTDRCMNSFVRLDGCTFKDIAVFTLFTAESWRKMNIIEENLLLKETEARMQVALDTCIQNIGYELFRARPCLFALCQ